MEALDMDRGEEKRRGWIGGRVGVVIDGVEMYITEGVQRRENGGEMLVFGEAWMDR